MFEIVKFIMTSCNFIWAFQNHYQFQLEYIAKEIFQKLSNELNPNIIILGLLSGNNEGHPICLEPPECGVPVDIFEGVNELAIELHQNDPRRKLHHTNTRVHRNYHEDLKKICFQEAVKQKIETYFKPLGKIPFLSWPVQVNKHDVFLILFFDEFFYEKLNLLNRSEKIIHDLRKSKVYRSLIEATIDVFLYEAIQPLYKPEQCQRAYDLDINYDEVLRKGGARFINTVITAACNSMTYNLFDICNYLSSLKYEGDSGYGNLVFAPNDHPNLNLKVVLENPIPLRRHRILRKLLEIASNELSLYSDGDKIIGFAELKGEYDPLKENLFEIEFLGDQKWLLKHSKETLMVIQFTNPNLPSQKLDKPKFDSTLRRIFEMSEPKIKQHWTIANAAIKQKHGTLIIISKEAKKEAHRLKNQSIPITPLKPNVDVMELITSIDGALLFDENGFCHSIGVILDGNATSEGNPSRGARYNSAIRYIEGNKGKAMAIIISKDGMVDISPDLMPQIDRNEITIKLEILEQESKKDTPDYDEWRPALVWFDRNRFYLQENICIKLNQIKKVLHEKLEKKPGFLYILFNDFKPNPKMDESYFLPN